LKILFATPFFFPDLRYGGSATASYNVLRELSRRGHEITVLTTVLGDMARLPRATREVDGIKVHYLKGHFEGAFLSHYLLRSLLEQPRPDLVHVNNYRNFPSDIVSFWAHRKSIPSIVSANGCIYAYRYMPSFPRTKRLLYQLHDAFMSTTIRKTTIALAVSAAEAEHYEEFGVPSERIRIVPNGIDLDRFSPGPSKSDPTPEVGSEPYSIGYIGRLDPIKGLLTLLRAFETISRETPGCKLVLVGPDFGMKRTLLSIVDARKLRGVTFLGPVSYDQLPRIYRALDVVVTPSLFEIFGMSTLEAMACGRPVVSTRVGGLCDLIQEGYNGYLVRSEDDAALANRVNYLLQHKDSARRLGENARKKALEYSVARTADLTEKAYLDCVALVSGKSLLE
jgi:glycosyltransferase involved in cell wall biosynthesis